MAYVLDITDKALYEVLIDGEKLIDKDFMMGIFDGITNKLPPLQEYLDFMLEKKQGSLLGSCKEEDKVLPWDLLLSELFYPTRKYIVDTNSFCIDLTYEAAPTFRVDFRDEREATAKYFSSIGGVNSTKKVEKEEKTAGKGILASNCVSESGHAAATYNLKVCGTIDLQHCAARSQSKSKNDFGREIELLVHGRKAFKEKITRGMGGFH